MAELRPLAAKIAQAEAARISAGSSLPFREEVGMGAPAESAALDALLACEAELAEQPRLLALASAIAHPRWGEALAEAREACGRWGASLEAWAVRRATPKPKQEGQRRWAYDRKEPLPAIAGARMDMGRGLCVALGLSGPQADDLFRRCADEAALDALWRTMAAAPEVEAAGAGESAQDALAAHFARACSLALPGLAAGGNACLLALAFGRAGAALRALRVEPLLQGRRYWLSHVDEEASSFAEALRGLELMWDWGSGIQLEPGDARKVLAMAKFVEAQAGVPDNRVSSWRPGPFVARAEAALLMEAASGSEARGRARQPL